MFHNYVVQSKQSIRKGISLFVQRTADNAGDKILNAEAAAELDVSTNWAFSPIKPGKKSHCGRNRMHARPNIVPRMVASCSAHFRFGHSSLSGHPLFCGRLTICDSVVAPISAPDGHRLISRNKRREKPSLETPTTMNGRVLPFPLSLPLSLSLSLSLSLPCLALVKLRQHLRWWRRQ